MLIRKLRKVADSYVLTIPKSVCEHHSFSIGDKLSIEPSGYGEIRIKKVTT